jgi:N-acetylglutamate synthase-like GNAT family acetyltransferase
MINLSDILIRTELQPGDLGYIIYMHGSIYNKENGYGKQFEIYVAEGLIEFYKQYDQEFDRIWICENNKEIIGVFSVMHRENNSAQLRYFLLKNEYRGLGLGKKLFELCIQFLHEHNYKTAYLWTTREQEKAISLYKRYGFKLTKEKESTLFGKPLIEQRYDSILI